MKGPTIVRKQRKKTTIIPLLAAAIILLSLTLALINPLPAYAQEQAGAQEVKTLRIGYFPNINHVGNNVNVETFQFNAGPSAIESLLANRIDVSYIGPNPAINGCVVSDGKEVRVIAGATKCWGIICCKK
jgi:NitT/TauT family transport system substrate-binding protein